MQSNLETNKENGNSIHPRVAVITGIVLAAAALRIVPHPMNFTPIGALALFGGAYFSSKRTAVAVHASLARSRGIFLPASTGSFPTCTRVFW